VGPLDVLLAPIRIPVRLAQALDDLATLAERARRDPDPIDEVRIRLDAALVELTALNSVAREIVSGGKDLEEVARDVRDVGRQIVTGGDDLRKVAESLNAETRRLEPDLETVADSVEPLGRVTRRLSRRS